MPCYRQYSSSCLFINLLNFLESCLRDSLVVVPLSSDITSHPWLCSSAIFARCKYYAQKRLQPFGGSNLFFAISRDARSVCFQRHPGRRLPDKDTLHCHCSQSGRLIYYPDYRNLVVHYTGNYNPAYVEFFGNEGNHKPYWYSSFVDNLAEHHQHYSLIIEF